MKASKSDRPEPYSKAEKNRMLLSAETILGLRRTGKTYIYWHNNYTKSFIGLVKYIFSLPEVTGNKMAFLSQNLCQDPLENFFGCQRQRRGTNAHPDVSEFF